MQALTLSPSPSSFPEPFGLSSCVGDFSWSWLQSGINKLKHLLHRLNLIQIMATQLRLMPEPGSSSMNSCFTGWRLFPTPGTPSQPLFQVSSPHLLHHRGHSVTSGLFPSISCVLGWPNISIPSHSLCGKKTSLIPVTSKPCCGASEGEEGCSLSWDLPRNPCLIGHVCPSQEI